MAPSTTSCILCSHPDRAELDAALDQGASVSDVARRAGTSRTSVRRHRAHRATPVVPGSTVGSPAPEALPRPPAQGAPIVEGDQVHLVDRPAVSDPAGLAPKRALPSITPPNPELAAPPGEDLVAFVAQLGAEIGPSPAQGRPGPGRKCACCISERRQEIDAAIGSGMSYRGIERRYGVSNDSARHHATVCVPELLARAADVRAAAEQKTVDVVLEEVSRLLSEARDGLAAATADDEAPHRDRATWFRELRQTVELLAKLRGEIVTTTNNYLTVFLNSKEWESTRKAIHQAILPTPGTVKELTTRGQVMNDVIAALRALDAR